jgi:hypothetical protein
MTITSSYRNIEKPTGLMMKLAYYFTGGRRFS